jgi:predicted  nucleic acid-binding Zn-ribbon protein
VAKKSASANGNGQLEQALTELARQQTAMMQQHTAMMQIQTSLNQNQALFNQNHAAMLARLSDLEQRTDERIARIETDIQAILRVLAEHSRILQALPEAIRDKIGFKTQP